MLALLVTVAPAAAEENAHPERSDANLEDILDGLERGIGALRALGDMDEAARLEKIANGVREEMRHRREPERGPGPEDRKALDRQIDVLQLAKKAWAERGYERAVEKEELAILTRKHALAGRTDDEAKELRAKAPDLGALAELLIGAAQFWKEHDNEKASHACLTLGEEFVQRAKREGGRQEGANREIEEA
jgi:hypothetical protein